MIIICSIHLPISLGQGSYSFTLGEAGESLESHCAALNVCTPFTVYRDLLEQTSRTDGCVQRVLANTKRQQVGTSNRPTAGWTLQRALLGARYFPCSFSLFQRRLIHNSSFRHALTMEGREQPSCGLRLSCAQLERQG